jgi:hypothetical protein
LFTNFESKKKKRVDRIYIELAKMPPKQQSTRPITPETSKGSRKLRSQDLIETPIPSDHEEESIFEDNTFEDDEGNIEQTPMQQASSSYKGKRRLPPPISDTTATKQSDMQAVVQSLLTQMERERADHREMIEKLINAKSFTASQISAEELNIREELDRFRKDAKSKLDNKLYLQLTASNYTAWRSSILADAQLISAVDIIMKEQLQPPQGLSRLDQEIWKKKNELLFTRIFQSLHYTVRDSLGTVDSQDAAYLWQRINAEYGISAAEERLTTMKALLELRLKNGDYLGYMRTFRNLRAKLKALDSALSDSAYHDVFIIGLGDWQYNFIKSRLDEFYSTGQGPIRNLDLEELMNQLAARVNKNKMMDPSSTKQAKANLSTTSSSESNRRRPRRSKCNYCNGETHLEDKCFYKQPELATEKWRNGNKDMIEKLRRKNSKPSISSQYQDSSANASTGKELVLANQPTANAAVSMIATAYSTVQLTGWLLDTAATFHMTNSLSAFASYTPRNDARSVETADGARNAIKAVGTVILEVDDGTLTLQDVRYIPSLNTSLISVGQLEQQGYDIYNVTYGLPGHMGKRDKNTPPLTLNLNNFHHELQTTI